MKRLIALLFALVAMATFLGLCYLMSLSRLGLTPTPTWTPMPTLTPTPTSTPKPTPAPIPTPPPLQVSGWEAVRVHTLCLEVAQSYPYIEGEFSQPIVEAAQRILAQIGIQVVPEGVSCDATLALDLTGQALRAMYIPGGYCYTGAEVVGQMTFAVPGREPLTRPVEGRVPTPDVVSGCPGEREAPFGRAWPEALLDGLAHLWGPRILIQALGDEEHGVRWGAIESLGERGPEAVSLLIKALGDEHEDIRSGAASALGQIGPEAKETVPALIGALRDEEWSVRMSAASALGKLGSEEGVIPALIQALEDEEWLVRGAAAGALETIGSEAKETVPALIQLLGDEEESTVRWDAVDALEAITGQDFGVDADAWEQWWKEQK